MRKLLPNCNRCNETDADKFYKKKRFSISKDGIVHKWTGWYTLCKKCHYTKHQKDVGLRRKGYYKQYRKDNAKVISKKKKAWYIHKRQAWLEVIQTRMEIKCVVCGYEKYFVALDFHHLKPKLKTINFHKLYKKALTQGNFDKVNKELDNVIILCATCHREVHIKGKTISSP